MIRIDIPQWGSCAADHPLYPQERRPERDGTLRVVYAARIGHCRPCPLREQCQWHGTSTKKPRRVSAVLHPLSESPKLDEPPQACPAACPILWEDWERRSHRRKFVKLDRSQRVDIRSDICKLLPNIWFLLPNNLTISPTHVNIVIELIIIARQSKRNVKRTGP